MLYSNSVSMHEKTNEVCEIVVEFERLSKQCEKELLKYGTIKEFLPMINAYVVEIPKDKIKDIATLKSVASVSENTRIAAQMNNGKHAVNCGVAHDSGLSGKSVTIAFLDTGIAAIDDFTKPKNRILAFKDFVNGSEFAYDDNGHGTHVAGIAAGNGALSKGRYSGLAFESNIVAVKVLDKNGQGNSVTALKGLQWVLDNKDRYLIKIVNLSIGALEADCTDPLVKAVNALWDSGVVVTAASGNNGPDSATITSPGTSKKIITVGASDDNREVQIWGSTLVNFSGRGPTKECVIKPDVLAPGSQIISALSPNSVLSRDKGKIVSYGYAKLSGTSMATPIVTGAIALLLEKKPLLTPNEVKFAVKQSSQSLNYPKNHQGWGLLDVSKLTETDSTVSAINGRKLSGEPLPHYGGEACAK